MQEEWEFKKVLECVHCHQPFRAKKPNQRFCHLGCEKAAWFKHVASEAARRLSPVPDKHRGGWGELIACAWLLENGYEVFRNVSSAGPVDIVAIKGNKKLLIDVKFIHVSVTKRDGQFTASGPALKKEQKKAGVIPLYVSPDGVCSFSSEDLARSYSGTLNQELDAMPQTW